MTRPPQVMVFHSHGVGQYVRIHELPLPGETVQALSWDNDRDGGKGSNVAMALGKLGTPTAFFGKLAHDIWAEMGLTWMRGFGVDLSLVLRSDAIRTSTGLVMIDDAGNNSIVTMNTGVSFTEDEIRGALDAAPDCRYFVTGFEIPWQQALLGARLAHERGMTAVLNPSPVPPQPMGPIGYVDILIVNEVEAERLSGLGRDSDPEQMLRALRDRYEVGAVVLTAGGRGSFGYDGQQYWQHGAIEVPVVDTTGAGDAFLACMTAELARGQALPDACRAAGAYAAMSVTRLGTFPAYPTRAELDAFLAEHGLPDTGGAHR